MKRRIVLSTIAIAIAIASIMSPVDASAHDWTFVYSHDEYGNYIDGSLSDLRAAALAGADVRVVLHKSSASNTSIVVDKIFIDDYAGTVTAIKLEFTPAGAQDLVLCRQHFTTLGELQNLFAANGYGLSNYTDRYPMSWYISGVTP